jgi:hypothetical protein
MKEATLIKKENQIYLNYKEIQNGRLQSHTCIWLMASSYMAEYLHTSSYIRKPFLIYDFATDLIWISLYMRKISFSFVISVDLRLPCTYKRGMKQKNTLSQKNRYYLLHLNTKIRILPVLCQPFLVIDQFGNLLSCVSDFCHLNSANQQEKCIFPALA